MSNIKKPQQAPQKNPMLSEKRYKFFRSMFFFALGLLGMCAIGLILLEVL